MKLYEAKNILKENGYLIETDVSAKKENSLTAAYKRLIQFSKRESGWEIKKYYKLDDLYEVGMITDDAKEADNYGMCLNIITLKKNIGNKDSVSIQLRFDDCKPKIRVELGDEYGTSEREDFKVQNVIKAINYAKILGVET